MDLFSWIFTILLLLLVGTFLDPIGAIMILVPILLPIATISALIRSITAWLSLSPWDRLYYPTAWSFTVHRISRDKERLCYVSRSILPSLFIFILSLFIIAFVPAISMVIPNILF